MPSPDTEMKYLDVVRNDLASQRGISTQLQRAAMSVPTNIVEGSAHASPREFSRYLRYSIASVSECEAHIQLGRDIGMISGKDFTSLVSQIEDIRKMLYDLLKKLNAGNHNQSDNRNEEPVAGNSPLVRTTGTGGG
jgi:four helix bundle protein